MTKAVEMLLREKTVRAILGSIKRMWLAYMNCTKVWFRLLKDEEESLRQQQKGRGIFIKVFSALQTSHFKDTCKSP